MARDYHDWFNPLILVSLYSVDKGKVIHLTRLNSLISESLEQELLDLSQKYWNHVES